MAQDEFLQIARIKAELRTAAEENEQRRWRVFKQRIDELVDVAE